MNIQQCLHRLSNSVSTLTCLESEGGETTETYAQLYERALALLGALQRGGVDPGRHLLLRLRGVRACVTALWACWLGGIVPVSMPSAAGEQGRDFISAVRERHDDPALLTDVPGLFEDRRDTLYYPGLDAGRAGTVHPMKDGDPALLQYTSGTAASPRCAVLTGANLYEGALASSVIVRPGVRERYLSWLPLSHIFGVVGNHLVPLFNDFDQYLMDTGRFVAQPGLWAQKLSEFDATVTGSSLFGLDLAARGAANLVKGETDLSSMYVCFCGGEDLKPRVLEGFVEAMAPFGWKKGVLLPAYGMSEATMGICYNPPGSSMRVHRIDPASVSIGGRLRFMDEGEGRRCLSRVALGVLDDCNDVEIWDLAGEKLPDGHLGVIRVKGTNVMEGYWKPPAGAPKNPDENGWLDTGDLGYFRDGWLTVFARHKDVVCLHGNNYVRTDLEHTAREAAGTGAFALVEAGGGLVIFGEAAGRGQLEEAARAVSEAWGLPLTRGVTLPRLPRTAKGGVDRLALAVQWERGAFAETAMNLAGGEKKGLTGSLGVMAGLWSGVLSLPAEEIALDSNFAALGGDSLKLIDLACAIEDEWGIFVDADELFAGLTLREMTELADGRRAKKG
jgi:acyl-CoA synthetase (AMP-forming)/AMP-acid ligase II/acyl carrier protein